MTVTASTSDEVQTDFQRERDIILRRASSDIAQVLQTMASIYDRSGRSDLQHKEVEDIRKAWKESFCHSLSEK